jgi:hypothetical protein
MATLGSTFLNLADLHSQQQAGPIIEVLHQVCPILQDAVTVPCNKGTTHLHSIRTGLPEPTWMQIYKGVKQSKSSRMNVEDTTGALGVSSTVAEMLLSIADNPALLRDSEARAAIEGITQEFERAFFYSDTATTPEKIKGIGARFNRHGTVGAARQVINAGGEGSDNTSIWFVTWGDNFCHLLHPKGTPAGIERSDKGSQRVTDENGDPYYVQEEFITMHTGVAVKDWRAMARIANIDVSNAVAGSVDLYRLMTSAYYRMQNRRYSKLNSDVPAMGRTVIYMNTTMLEVLDNLAHNKGAADNYIRLRPMEIEGREVMSWRGIPIRECDAILNTEAVVPAL